MINLNGTNIIAILAAVFLAALFIGGTVFKFKPRNLNTDYFQKRWKEAQRLCAEQDTWPLAIINADKLLDDALKRSHYKGKSMGERLAAAQHELTDNDGVWFAHKIRNRLVHEQNVKINKRQVKKALIGVGRALKDLGAI
jgi:hypothetical protein